MTQIQLKEALMIKVNGLKSCDSCKKALKWLDAEGLEGSFRDVRAEPVSLSEVERWGSAVGFDVLVNKASTTWRALDDKEKAAATGTGAAALLVANPTLIKRPVFEAGDAVIVGFKAAQQAALKAL
jgi:Spx/MgsR family transcriptional regulator